MFSKGRVTNGEATKREGGGGACEVLAMLRGRGGGGETVLG